MMLLLFIAIGALLGAFMSYAFDMKSSSISAIVLGATGGLIGGLVLYMLTPFWAGLFGVLGALLGAGILPWLVSRAAR